MLLSLRPAVLLLLPVLLGIAACQAHVPPMGPEETCVRACQSHARACSELQCDRGCNLVIDRLIERERENVIACVAKSKESCDDVVWADCATRIGPHADGGPPPPPPPEEEQE